ncbi:arsenate reductase ArsC [Pseudorhodoferax sp.]|uniref:arsenate reductase ArsC n=1 Tax=Pseudorhodoferax sp. TaxID=1993553 RepID=UPI002DD6A3DE|nr:arsenate reductase ArsC [Pseudorhodoferax sp.]
MDETYLEVEPYNVLFISTGNSARCIMAQSILDHSGRGRFKGHSAGTFPKGEIHPMAVAELQAMQVPVATSGGKSWNDFAHADAQEMDFIFTVCDEAAGETCPVWPGQPLSAHWGVADPAAVQGDDARRQHAFREAALAMKRRIDLMLALPLDKLDRMAIHQHIKDIGAARH